MDDLISRQAAIDAVAKWLYEVFGIRESDGTATIFKRLRKLPSAQPEIIRCKDCKHKPHTSDEYDYVTSDGFEIIFPDYCCPCRCEDEYYNHLPDDNWFCGNGERRTDEDKN